MKEQTFQGIKSRPPRCAGFSILNLLIVVLAVSGFYFGISTPSPLGYVIIGGSVLALISALRSSVTRRYGNVAERQKQVSADDEARHYDEIGGIDGEPRDAMSPESATLAVFNHDFLLDSMDGDYDSVMMILDVFLEEHVDDGKKVRQALISGDREQAQLIAHSLKGVSSSLGAESLRLLSEQLEIDIRDGVEQLQPLCQQLDKDLDQLKRAVSEFLQQTRSEMLLADNDVQVIECDPGSTLASDSVESDSLKNDSGVIEEYYAAAEYQARRQREQSIPRREVSMSDE